MFVALLLENVFTLVVSASMGVWKSAQLTLSSQSILVVSQDSATIVGQLPYILGSVLAITFDLIFLVLHVIFAGAPLDFSSTPRPWWDAHYIVEHSLPDLPSRQDMIHRRVLAREWRAYSGMVDEYTRTASRLAPEDARRKREALRRKGSSLSLATENLELHISESRDLQRIAAHSKSALNLQEEMEMLQTTLSRQEASEKWAKWSPV